MYSHLDYLKVLAVLNQVRDEAKTESNDYCLIEVLTFEEKDLCCFNAIGDLFFPENFLNPDTFALIYAKVYLDEEVLFAFSMGQLLCKIVSFGNLQEEDTNTFKKIFPFEKEDSSWEIVLADFIRKIRIIVKERLKLREE